MVKRIICAFSLLLMFWLAFLLPLSATIHRVSRDGSQYYRNIQFAIQNSADGDTVLAYPGTYVENINYSGKNITIASLELTTGDPIYREQTIINGNHNGSTVLNTDPVTNASLIGFTVINGTGHNFMLYGASLSRGGGVSIQNATSFYLSHCIIKDNYASYLGGGLVVRSSTVYMSDCLITNNYALGGGGIAIEYYGKIIFDQVNRSSVYENSAAIIQDVAAFDTRLDCSIYLDITTVNPVSDFYIRYLKSSPGWPGNIITVDVMNGFRTETNSDLYVSPTGNNDNNGLSASTPLKTICRAVQLIASDSLNTKTIHLASGTYSSSDGQFFPIGMKSYVTLEGDSTNIPILENTDFPDTIVYNRLINTTIKNIILEHGDYSPANVVAVVASQNTLLKNIRINSCRAIGFGGIQLASSNFYPSNCTIEDVTIVGQIANESVGIFINVVDAVLKNVVIDDCHNIGSEINYPYPVFYFCGNRLIMENCQITNNSVLYEGSRIVSIGPLMDPGNTKLSISNLLLANNSTTGNYPFELAHFRPEPATISNCTFSRNSGPYPAVMLKGNVITSNCIFDNDTSSEIDVPDLSQYDLYSNVTFRNNLIKNYLQGVYFPPDQATFNEFTISGDPGFCGGDPADPLSYRLGNGSICRDIGIMDTTGLSLPDTDLAGNPRIYGVAVDLGCYEWNYPVGIDEEPSPATVQIQTYPNPFVEQLSMVFDLKQSGHLTCDFYNLRGQKVRSIADAPYSKGDHMLIWDGCNNSGRRLGSGVYIMRMKLDGKMIYTKKIVMMK